MLDIAQDRRTPREMLATTQAEINKLMTEMQALYRLIERKAERVRVLEDRAAILGDHLCRATRSRS